MQTIEHISQLKRTKSFKTEKIAGMFDIPVNDEICRKFSVAHDINETEWSVGLVVGPSGSGKSTIAKALFKELTPMINFTDRSIVDNIDAPVDEIIEFFCGVGFSSPPSWLLPYSVLSNGQQFRAQLASMLIAAANNLPIVFDEFTSVVDRTVAKATSAAVAKLVRRKAKKFVAVTCHYDIIEWLQPDWVIDMADSTFSRRSLQRPPIKCDIRRAHKSEWSIFKMHHYLSSDLNPIAKSYVAEIDGRAAAFCACLHFLHAKVKNMRRIHRIVTLPDFQGFGIGPALLNFVCELNHAEKYRTGITTSHPGLIHSLHRSKQWRCCKPFAISSPLGVNAKMRNRDNSFNSFGRCNASFEWIKT